jgi:hypothetical protein
MSTYSFLNIVAAINGPGGSINLGMGAALAEEGISVEATGDKSAMTIGTGGEGMHSLFADNSGTITVRMLKTSPVNAQLQNMYNFQTQSSATHGRNTITIRDAARGDSITATEVAFKKRAPLSYAKEGGMNEWIFDAIKITQILGVGTPEI